MAYESGLYTHIELIELHKAAKIRILASFGEKRSALLPGVPAMNELGFKDATGSGWYSLWAPAKTPRATLPVQRARDRQPVGFDVLEALVPDLLEWIGPGASPYPEVIDTWRTSCPRLPGWEEANARGYIGHRRAEGAGTLVSVSPSGRAVLNAQRRTSWSVPGGSGPAGDGTATCSGKSA